MNSLNEQRPATKNQISNNKPDVIKNMNILQGYIGNSMNGGMIKPIAYIPIMTGTQVGHTTLRANFKMLTPKTPVYQKLKLNIKTFFVPNQRVWNNALEFQAQRGGATVEKVKEIPNIGGKKYQFIYMWDKQPTEGNATETFGVPYVDTDFYRDSWVSSYIPKYQTGLANDEAFRDFPKVNVLPLRGFKAIYNDFLRNKEYDEELTEYKDDTVSNAEFNGYFPQYTFRAEDYLQKLILRGRRQNSYFTDYRTSLLGEDTELPTGGTQPLLDYVEWTKQVAQLRSDAENAQLNDVDVIAKIRGAKKLTEGRVNLLSEQTIGLNYQSVTQDTYNVNTNIDEQFQSLGQQGAYSYTEVEIPITNYEEFNEDGFIHVIAQVTADSVFETAFDRLAHLNVSIDDYYRPDLKELKEDVLYEIEKCGTRIPNANALKAVTGYKRKFSEYFKLPNCISGDITSRRWIKTVIANNTLIGLGFDDSTEPTQFEGNRTFTFFEPDDKTYNNSQTALKNIWQDYTDLLINNNQAVMNEYNSVVDLETGRTNIWVRGDNQIFFVGMITMVASLPIDENIKHNYTLFGEK